MTLTAWIVLACTVWLSLLLGSVANRLIAIEKEIAKLRPSVRARRWSEETTHLN